MPTSGPATARRRRQLTRAIKASLRELSNQLSLLNHHVSAHIDLNDTDLDCLELINRHGPLNPSALARRAGLHPRHHHRHPGPAPRRRRGRLRA
jgi:DNA-binding MarR family transcriptional regulator